MKKWLITIDLDGTMLVKEKPGKHTSFDVHPKNIEMVNKLMEAGHNVAIVTGRPWRDTKIIYQSLDLDTVIGNFNGAFIHNPSDEGFVNAHQTLNRVLLQKFIKHSHVKTHVKNFIIEDIKTTHIFDISDEIMMNQFHVSDDPLLKKYNEEESLSIDPYSAIIRLSNKIDKDSWIKESKKLFGRAFAMRYWIRDNNYYLEINAKTAHKANAMRTIAAYYNIDIMNTIAFGDGENDLEMLSEATHGVAMKNASQLVKDHAKFETELTNDEGGVGFYLEKFFKNI